MDENLTFLFSVFSSLVKMKFWFNFGTIIKVESYWPLLTTFSTFLFFKNVGEIPGEFCQIPSKFERLSSFLFTILAPLRVNCAQVRLWCRFNWCNLFKICLILFNFIYILFCQLYTRKPRPIYAQLRKSAHTYALSRFLLR